MPPKNILFTLPTLSPTDSKLPRVLAICRALDRRKFQPIVSVDHAGRLHAEGLELLKEAQVPVCSLRMSPHKSHMARSLMDMARTPGLLRKSHVVIQHSSDYSEWWTEPLLARLGSVRYWITTKTNMACEGLNWRFRLQSASSIVVEAPQVARQLAKAVPSIEQRLVLIPKGIDTDVFRPRPRDEKLASDLAVHGDKLVLGCIAHLVPVKDHPSLLRALSLVRRSDIELLFVGAEVDANYTKELKQQLVGLGLEQRVHFLGRRSDINRLHSVLDGLVLISKSETSPYAVLEGMASGLPIISSDVGGLPEAVQTGTNGWLVPRDEDFVATLAAAIDEWASDAQRRKMYGNASRRIVEERFSLTLMAQRYIQLFESLVERDK